MFHANLSPRTLKKAQYVILQSLVYVTQSVLHPVGPILSLTSEEPSSNPLFFLEDLAAKHVGYKVYCSPSQGKADSYCLLCIRKVTLGFVFVIGCFCT